MVDITMCLNKTCPSRNTCYRFTATPSEFAQSYANFEPEHPDLDKCDYYWKDNRLSNINKNKE